MTRTTTEVTKVANGRKKPAAKMDGFICYKDDEDRFSQKYTLKMKTSCYYNVAVEIDQDLQLSYVILGESFQYWLLFFTVGNFFPLLKAR